MRRQIDLAAQQGFLDLLHEQSLPANLGQWDVKNFVSRCLDPPQRHRHIRSQRVQLSLHPLALPHCELATSRSQHDSRSFMADFQHGSLSPTHIIIIRDRGHCDPFAAWKLLRTVTTQSMRGTSHGLYWWVPLTKLRTGRCDQQDSDRTEHR